MATPRVTSVPRAKLVPFGHQESGAAFLAARKAAGLFDDPGLGKTGTALLAAQRADARTILIVCPVVVLRNWEREVQLWIGPRRVQILRRSEHHIQPGVEVVIVPYSLIANPKLRRTLMARRWDVCIVDEAHYLKTPSAQRTVSMYGLGRS
jgi:SWI/SNF-related matrix-associated actin-dependent regulator 1 of chromatin subfamily A